MTNQLKVKQKYVLEMPDTVREFIAEFLGTFIIVFMDLSALMLMKTNPNKISRVFNDPMCSSETDGCTTDGQMAGDHIYDLKFICISIIVIAMTFGSALLGSIMIAGSVSGGYLNPGTTICVSTFSIVKHVIPCQYLHWKKLFHYIPAQYLGGFMSSAAIHALYWEYMKGRNEDVISYVMVIKPISKTYLWISLLDGIVECGLYMSFYSALIDDKNHPLLLSNRSVVTLFSFVGLVITFTSKWGVPAALNPARDLGPRLYASFVIGVKPAFGTFGEYYWFILQQIALYLGYLIGGWSYVLLFGPRFGETSKETIRKESDSEILVGLSGEVVSKPSTPKDKEEDNKTKSDESEDNGNEYVTTDGEVSKKNQVKTKIEVIGLIHRQEVVDQTLATNGQMGLETLKQPKPEVVIESKDPTDQKPIDNKGMAQKESIDQKTVIQIKSTDPSTTVDQTVTKPKTPDPPKLDNQIETKPKISDSLNVGNQIVAKSEDLVSPKPFQQIASQLKSSEPTKSTDQQKNAEQIKPIVPKKPE